MVDDINQDLPVKEVAITTMQPSSGPGKHIPASQVVRCELEDKYLNLRQENDELKMKLHSHEDKMKKLATKLMRLVSEQKQQLGAPEARRALELQVTVSDQAEHINELQATNRALQERVSVLRQQLLEQSRLRARIPGYLRGSNASPAASPRRKKPPASSSVKPADTPEPSRNAEVEKLQARITLLEQEKAGLNQRLEEAELQEKKRQVGENVELIRLRRALAQQSAQLVALEERAQAAEGDHVQARQALATAQREAEDMQQQRNVLKKRVLDLEAELQSLHAERWRMLELEVAVKDLQRERDTLQGQNNRLLAMTEERTASSQDQRVRAAQLEERLADEVAQRATLQDRLRIVEKELVEVKSQAAKSPRAPISRSNSSAADQDSSLLMQVGQLEADLAREMRERVQLLQMLERLHDQQHQSPVSRSRAVQPQDDSTIEHGEQVHLSSAVAERQPQLQSNGSSREPLHLTAHVPNNEPGPATESRQSRSVGCMTEIERQLDKGLQVSLDEGRANLTAGQTPRVPSLEQTKQAVMSRVSRGPLLRIPTLAESAGVPDEQQSEATDVDVSLLGEKSPGEVSSESVGPGAGAGAPDKSQGEVTIKTVRYVTSSFLREKLQREMSSESEQLRDLSCHVEKSQGEVSSCVDGSTNDKSSLLSDKFSAADHLETVHELEKYRDLLRVQCGINSSLQDEVTLLRQRLGQAGTGHMRQLAELRRRLEERPSPGPRRPAPRGSFVLHMGHLQLCPGMESLLDGALFLSWTFCDQEVSCTPPQPAHTSINYEYSTVYQVDVNRSFLDYLCNEKCEVELLALSGEGNQLKARGFLHFTELLHFPHNKLHASVPLISPDGHTTVGTLHCWFRLVYDANLPLPSENLTRPSHTGKTTSPLAPVPIPRVAFPFSSVVTSVADVAPTPAPRSILQPPRRKSGTDSAASGAGGEGNCGGEESAVRMKQLAGSILGQADSTQHRLTQILEEKWQQRKQTVASQLVTSTSPASLSSSSSPQEQSRVDENIHACVAQGLEVWLDYLRLLSDSEVIHSKKQHQFQVECCFSGHDSSTTVATFPFHQHDADHGTFTFDFHTAYSLNGEGSSSKLHVPLTPLDTDSSELLFLIGCTADEGGDLQPIGRASGDLVRAACSTVGRAELQLDVVDSTGSVVGELGVSAALRSNC